MPYRDVDNQYPIDPNGKETVKWYRITYRRAEAEAVLKDRLIQLSSQKLILIIIN